ncbi:HlyD family secretion protein [Salinivirga cyanobacteriivorans]
MKNSSIVVGATILILVVIMSIIGWVAFKPAPVILQGEVEATEINVATKLTGRMIEKYVKEGDNVEKGDTLLRINSPEVNAKLQQAQAAKNAASAQNKKADKGARQEQINAARNVWLKAKAAAELAKKTYERVNNLYKDGVLPAQKRDEAETQMKAAQLTENAAKANYDMAKSGTRSEDKMAAKAMVDKAEGAISEVQAFLQETSVIAPQTAEIAQINAEQGELVTAGFPVITLVDLNDTWFTFNIREDLLHKFKKGKTFNVRIPALNDSTIEVKINYIHARGDYATWRATKAQGDFDKKMFEVRALPANKIEGLRPGMSALVNWSDLN